MKIGSKKTVNLTTFLLPEGEVAEFNFIYHDENHTFKVIFKNDEEKKNERRLDFFGEENLLRLEFTNWNSNLRMSTREAIKVGDNYEGLAISILASVTRSYGIHHVTIQTMIG